MTRTEISNGIRETLTNRRLAAEADMNDRRALVYSQYPEIEQLDTDIKLCNLSIARSILTGNHGAAVTLDEELDDLLSRRESLLDDMGIPGDYNRPYYTCRICGDTGYVVVDGERQKCSCAIAIENELYADVTGLKPCNYLTFDSCDLSRFSNRLAPGSLTGESPRDNMRGILAAAKEFVSSDPRSSGNNLLFMGAAGTGKTHMMKIICSELLTRGTFCVYRTAPQLFDCLMNHRMNRDDTESVDAMVSERAYNAPVLCIDDLGTETPSPAKYSELISILDNRASFNGRYNRRTVIATNLRPDDLRSFYDSRIVSRLLGTDYSLYFFEGEDLRAGMTE